MFALDICLSVRPSHYSSETTPDRDLNPVLFVRKSKILSRFQLGLKVHSLPLAKSALWLYLFNEFHSLSFSHLLKPHNTMMFLYFIITTTFVLQAISVCLSEKNIFTHDVIAGILQQLSEKNPMPNIMMRTVIQSLALYPKLSGFVINLLQRLILKQVSY